MRVAQNMGYIMLPSQTGPGLSRRRIIQLSAAAGVAAARPAAARAADTDLTSLTLAQAAQRLREGHTSSVALTNACLARIARYQKALNAFITITPERALADARAMDAELAAGKWRGPLHGVPIALKDNIDTAGVATTAASALFADRISAEDAEVARRLKTAGTVILGKLNMDEFAHGSHSAASYYKPVHNPWALDRVPGGSSGGPAAAVAAELCYGALGTDTAGSVRAPASLCGIVGLRPTYGRVSNRGVIPAAWTLDTVGPMCRTVEDAALMLQAIAGYDAADISSADAAVPDYLAGMKTPVDKMRIGIPRAQFYDDFDPEVAAAVDAALAVIRGFTAGMRDMELPAVGTLIRPIQQAETMGYHAQWFTKNPQLYQPSFRKVLEQAVGASAAEYAAARRQVELLRRQIDHVFTDIDLLITPTRKTLPDKIEDILKGFAGGAPSAPFVSNTFQFSIFGLPALSVPCGFSKAGLPIGLQIVGPHWAEARVMALAAAFEQATPWHKRRPPPLAN